MRFETIIILFIYLISIVIVVAFHEFLHWIMAKYFNRNPKIYFGSFFTPIIRYKNNNNDLQNIIIASIAPAISIILGLFISSENQYLVVAKVILLSNIINLLPITSDGKVILISIIKLIKKVKR